MSATASSASLSSSVDGNISAQPISNLNANQNDKRGSRFCLKSYYSRKVVLKQKYSERMENQKIQLKSCCLMSFEQKNRVNADKLVESIKEALIADEFESILQVGQFRSTKIWSIHFKDNDKFVSASNKKFKFDNNMYRLIPANEFDKKNEKNTENNEFIMTAFYRIHWLPLDAPDNEIEEFFNSNLSNVDVDEIKHEKLKLFENINNGVVKIKVKYNVSLHNAVLDFAGLHIISNYQVGVGNRFQRKTGSKMEPVW
ncbi:hypothetical protein BpHYR1_004430 [Brachionus plicatilis]|uniref:Uncharacterized protein n=1 Tax=Brachionus plicatilis TaxID=10195 RepID=A0A3M7QMH8_BRAPC|nr:hypothetical protein BpHYR1_004430 [Brachionus plicatilis]